MAMAPQGQAHHQHGQPNSSATNRPWEPFSAAGDFAIHMALFLTFLLGALALAIGLQDAVLYLLGRCHRARRVHAGSGSGERVTERDSNANISDPENPAVEAPPPLPPDLYSAASTMLAGSVAECAICLAEFTDGDAIRVMLACRHGFHASCIEPWLAGGGRSSCPTCRAPAAVATAAAAAVQPDEATNWRERYCGAGDYDARYVTFFIVAALQTIALVLALLDAIVRHIREGK